MSAPARTERRNAYSVFDGNSSSPPWCAMFSTRFFSHGFCAPRAGWDERERDEGEQRGQQDGAHGAPTISEWLQTRGRVRHASNATTSASAATAAPNTSNVVRNPSGVTRMPASTAGSDSAP